MSDEETTVKAAWREDGLVNALTGLGGSNDKGQAGQWTRTDLMSRTELENMYIDSDVAAIIVDALPEDAGRAGITVNVGTDDVDEEADENVSEDPWTRFLRKHKVVQKFVKASKWARLYGGAAIIIGARDGLDPEEELNVESLDDIAWLRVVDMWELLPSSFETDFTSDNYNEPKTYTLYPTSVGGTTTFSEDKGKNGAFKDGDREIHHTRVLRFEGDDIPTKLSSAVGYWGLSVLQKTSRKVNQFTTVEQAMANRITESQYDVVFLDRLGEILDQENGESKVRTRVNTMSVGKGPIKAIVLDGNDRFENRTAVFTGLSEIYNSYGSSLAAAAQMSRVRLFGEPPGGLSTDDAAGRKNWHDRVDQYREEEWREPMEYLLTLAMRAKNGPTKGVVPDDWALEFGDLEQMTPEQEAIVKKTYAEMDKMYWEMGVYTAEEIRISRFGSAQYGLDIELQEEVSLTSQEAADFGDPMEFEPSEP